jgi:hypothetical protein
VNCVRAGSTPVLAGQTVEISQMLPTLLHIVSNSVDFHLIYASRYDVKCRLSCHFYPTFLILKK